MKNKYLFTQCFFTLLFLLQASLVMAHSGSVGGTITEGQSGKGLDAAGIYLKENGLSAVTNTFGQFLLRGVQPGNYTLVVTHVGYQTIKQQIIIEDGVTTSVTIILLPSGINLKEVTVNTARAQTFTSLSDLDLKLRPLNTAQDFMRLVPGLFTSQHQGGGKAEQMFLRGFDIDHGTDIQVTVDDMPVNMVSHAHGQGYADLHFVIPELVQRLDFGKGPYQADKGNFATAGFASFKTFDELEQSFVKLEGGMFGHFRTVAGIDLLNSKTGAGKSSAYIAGEYNYNRGYFDAPQHFNRMNIMGKYTTQLAADKQLSISLSGFSSNWDASGQIPERAVAQGLIGRFGELDPETGNTFRYNLNIQYQQAINEHSMFKSNAYIAYYDFDLTSNFTFFLNDPINGDQIRQKEKRILAGYNAKYFTDYKLMSLNARTEIGGGFRHDNTSNSELSHTLNRETILNRLAYGDIRETNLFAYASQHIFLSPRLVFNAALRFDYFIHDYKNKLPIEAEVAGYDTKGLSPKAGLYYNFSNSGRIYANYGTGFHSNDTRVVVARQGMGVLPMAHSYDLGIVLKPYARMLLSSAVWMLDLQQEFVYVGDEAVVEPSGRTRRLGADLSARYEISSWLFLDMDVNYTYARARDEEKGADYIPLAAKLTSIGGITFKKDRIGASLRYRHLGDRAANEDNSVIAKGYTVCDAVFSYTMKHFEFGVQVQNLFNTKWNEAQFDTESRLRHETASVSEIHFTPGSPFFLKLTAAYRF